jgi:hypothetical protein
VIIEPRYGLEVRAAPWLTDDGATRFWVGVRAEGGDFHSVSVDTFRGVYSEWAGGLSVGVAQRITTAFGVALHVGATLNRSVMSGTLLEDDANVERAELSAAAHFRPEMELGFGSLGVILQPSLGLSLQPAQYTAEALEVLETRRVWWALGGAVRLDVF